MIRPCTRLVTALTVTLALALSLVTRPAAAMEPPAYAALRAQVTRTAFSSARLDVVKVAASSNTFTSAQAKGLIQAFSFSSGKLKALRALSPRIVDPRNSFVILDAFTFSSDKKKAAAILRTAGSSVQHAPPPPQHAPPAAYRAPPHAVQPVPMQPVPMQPAAGHGAPASYPATAAWAAQGYGHVHNVWPESALRELYATLQHARFSRDKLAALKLAVGSRHDGLTADQVLTTLKAFGFSRDMVAALRILEPKILAMPAQDVARIITLYPFSSDRLHVLRALKDTILDLENKHVILAAFTFSSDKRKAAKILAGVQPRSPLYGTIRGRHVVFVIDCSGSMGAEVFTNAGRRVNRLDYVRYELGRALAALPAGATFNIVVFAGGVLRWQPRGVAASVANQQQAMAFMAHQRPEGGTNIWDAMKTALQEPGVDEVHFLTDGTPTAGPVRGHAEVLRKFRTLLPRRRVPIHGAALLMGTWRGDRKAQSAELVCAIAHETGGLCRVLQ